MVKTKDKIEVVYISTGEILHPTYNPRKITVSLEGFTLNFRKIINNKDIFAQFRNNIKTIIKKVFDRYFYHKDNIYGWNKA